ncbi:YitT family protein [Anaerorhabdus sp.]
MVIVGCSMFSLATNLFIIPHGLYNGGFVGVAQLVIELINRTTSLNLSNNLTGMVNFLINIPIFFFTYRLLSKKFFFASLVGMLVITLTLSIIPVSTVPILEDTLSSCVIGAILGGLGIGITLLNGGSGGGMDIVGVYAALRWKGFSVGKIQLFINVLIYLMCALLFSLPTAIYSIIFQFLFSMVIDKIHYQNIEINAMVFSKNREIKHQINSELGRGVTFWKGFGAYTNEETEVFVVVVSKYEIHRLEKLIRDLDPKAFIIFSESYRVSGGFEKRLVEK